MTTTEDPNPTISAFLHAPATTAGVTASLRRMLRAVRTHLGMEVGFASHFDAGRRVFRAVDTDVEGAFVTEGASDPIDGSFCGAVVDGRLPELIGDASVMPAARALSRPVPFPIGAHLSVPVKLSDGTTYGTFCCFSSHPDLSLTGRDVAVLRVFADLAADLIERERTTLHEEAAVRHGIVGLLSRGPIKTVFQAVVEPRGRTVLGFEALSRFGAEPRRPPNVWFAEAASVGLGVELELACVERALRALERLPSGLFLALNMSPKAIVDDRFARLLGSRPLERIVLELTEHAMVVEYEDLASVLAPLRAAGLRIAIDDAGAGYASFRHVVRMAPDVIKLDLAITRNVDRDRPRRALAAALIGFARETGATITAEGIETPEELAALVELGVDAAQGYLLGRPLPLEQALAVGG